MLQMDLPHLNVLTKIDNLRNYPNLPFNLDFYTEVQDLQYLLPHLNREQTSGIPGPTRAGTNDVDPDDDEPTSKFSALNKAIVELVEDFALVGFETLQTTQCGRWLCARTGRLWTPATCRKGGWTGGMS